MKKDGSIVEVDRNTAHTLIDKGEAELVRTQVRNEPKSSYTTKPIKAR